MHTEANRPEGVQAGDMTHEELQPNGQLAISTIGHGKGLSSNEFARHRWRKYCSIGRPPKGVRHRSLHSDCDSGIGNRNPSVFHSVSHCCSPFTSRQMEFKLARVAEYRRAGGHKMGLHTSSTDRPL